MNLNNVNYPAPKQEYKVLVRCATFNHSKYIEDALDGFAMQQTNFPFVCLVMDDASTDGEQDVIKAWMEHECDMSRAENIDIPTSLVIVVPHKSNTSCTFAFYLLKQNLYGTGKKIYYLNPWREKCEYEALCEGDDYWIDPLKLQKQVDFLDSHEEHILTCAAGKILSNNFFTNWGEVGREQDLTPEQLILGFWGYIPTASLLFRMKIFDVYPEYCKKCAVGDRPLKLFCSLVGKVHYFNEEQVVYRYNNVSGISWSARSAKNSNILLGMNLSLAEVEYNLDVFSGYKYTKAFNTARARRVLHVVKDDPYNAKNNFKKIHELVPDYKKYLTLKDKVLIRFILFAPSLFVGLRKLISVIKK